MKRTIFLTGLVSLLAICLSSCGSNSLRTIQLTAPSTELQGIGGTIQLQAQGTYAYGPNRDLTDLVTYTVVVNAAPNNVDVNGFPLPTPPSTIKINSTGLITGVNPAVCSYQDVGTTTTPAWALTGTYMVTATYRGVTSQPVFIGVASAIGSLLPPALGACGPTTTGG